MSKFKIEKNQPMPETFDGASSRGIYPFDEMEVGDSFFVPCKKENEFKSAVQSVHYANSKERKKESGKIFKRSQIGSGVRIWRVE